MSDQHERRRRDPRARCRRRLASPSRHDRAPPLEREAAGEVVDEVLRDATGAARAIEREAQRLGVQPLARHVEARLVRVAIDDAQVGRLVEAVEAEHQTEAVGERELLLERLADVQLAVARRDAHGAVVGDALRQQVAAVAGRDDAHVARAAPRRCPRARPSARACRARRRRRRGRRRRRRKRYGRPRSACDHVGQVEQIVACRTSTRRSPRAPKRGSSPSHRRGLARAALAEEQHVVRGQAAHELLGVARPAPRPSARRRRRSSRSTACGSAIGTQAARAARARPSETRCGAPRRRARAGRPRAARAIAPRARGRVRCGRSTAKGAPPRRV